MWQGIVIISLLCVVRESTTTPSDRAARSSWLQRLSLNESDLFEQLQVFSLDGGPHRVVIVLEFPIPPAAIKRIRNLGHLRCRLIKLLRFVANQNKRLKPNRWPAR